MPKGIRYLQALFVPVSADGALEDEDPWSTRTKIPELRLEEGHGDGIRQPPPVKHGTTSVTKNGSDGQEESQDRPWSGRRDQ
jgi:hypothetical protein